MALSTIFCNIKLSGNHDCPNLTVRGCGVSFHSFSTSLCHVLPSTLAPVSWHLKLQFSLKGSRCPHSWLQGCPSITGSQWKNAISECLQNVHPWRHHVKNGSYGGSEQIFSACPAPTAGHTFLHHAESSWCPAKSHSSNQLPALCSIWSQPTGSVKAI